MSEKSTNDVVTAADTVCKPLRAVVDWFLNEHGAPCEKLECGHIVHVKQDAFGHTNAARRRCRQCAAESARRLALWDDAMRVIREAHGLCAEYAQKVGGPCASEMYSLIPKLDLVLAGKPVPTDWEWLHAENRALVDRAALWDDLVSALESVLPFTRDDYREQQDIVFAARDLLKRAKGVL